MVEVTVHLTRGSTVTVAQSLVLPPDRTMTLEMDAAIPRSIKRNTIVGVPDHVHVRLRDQMMAMTPESIADDTRRTKRGTNTSTINHPEIVRRDVIKTAAVARSIRRSNLRVVDLQSDIKMTMPPIHPRLFQTTNVRFSKRAPVNKVE